ncbi:hypothetical protein KAR91_15685 [Candidatus Pacearchaeota archaeon]|nr:hypothetical protein [Candidatus Pacearchaeota archaeon]
MGKKTKSKLKDHEVMCPECKGTGKLKSWTSGNFEITPECSKCLGEGKFDWIERIMGKPRRIYQEFDLSEEVVRVMAKELSDDIDKEILESICMEASYNSLEQNKKRGGGQSH